MADRQALQFRFRRAATRELLFLLDDPRLLAGRGADGQDHGKQPPSVAAFAEGEPSEAMHPAI